MSEQDSAGGIIALIADVIGRRGADSYLGEAVTMAEHMLQAASLALREGADEALVAAALLHDIGHYTSEFGEYTAQDTVDRYHDAAGARVLEGAFPPMVVACVRLHVAAKRYLCATDPAYYDALSPASKHTLSLQGGAMNPAEVEGFQALDFHAEAVRVRRWDDLAKVPGAATPSLEDFRPLLERVLARG